MKRFLFISLSFWFSTSYAQKNDLQTARIKTEEGAVLLRKGNFKAAEIAFTDALKLAKNDQFKNGNPQIYALIANAYWQINDLEMANANYLVAHDIDPNNAFYTERLAELNMLMRVAASRRKN
jgi:tetratricopeptide (TPR) repeat protein